MAVAKTKMSAQVAESERRPWLWRCSGALVVLLTAGLYLLNEHWPYRHRVVEPTLERIFASHITIAHYHRTYFPYPGFVADGLTLRRNTAPNLPPVGSVEHVRVEGSWLDLLLLRRRIARVYAEGLHVVIPAAGSQANHEDFPPGSGSDFEGPTTVVGSFLLEDTVLDILRTDGSRYTFPIRRLLVTDLEKNASIGYVVDMRTPRTGHIRALGHFGPLVGKQLAQTAASGDFTYDDVVLDGISDLHGTFRMTGSFRGTLGALEARAQHEVKDFSVNQGHRIQIAGSATGAVDALNGDILLHAVDVHTAATEVHAEGRLVGGPKVTDLEVSVAKGRAEDLLAPFMRAQPPVVGPVRLHTHVHVEGSHGGERFLDRMTMKGAFEIPEERLTKGSTERSVTAFSERAQGMPGNAAAEAATEHEVISSLVGAVIVRRGVAYASRLVFTVPGASIAVNGSYSLRDHAVNMLGELRMQSDVSHATTGFKSFLLRPLAPFFRKRGAGAVVPVKVTGRPGTYKIGQNIFP